MFQLSISVFSREKCHYQSHWYSTFTFWEILNVFVYKQCFSNHNPRKFRQTTMDREEWRFCHSFINLTEWREMRVTCQQLIGVKVKNYRNFFDVCCYGFSQGWKSLCNTAVYVMNYFLICLLFRLEVHFLWGCLRPRTFEHTTEIFSNDRHV